MGWADRNKTLDEGGGGGDRNNILSIKEAENELDLVPKIGMFCFPCVIALPNSGKWYLISHILVFVTQLPHSYYFTTRILVLTFVNKGIFFEEIQDSHFLRKRRYFGTHLREFGGKCVIFYVQHFTVKRGVHLGWQVRVYHKKGVHFGLKSPCFIAKKGYFELKSQRFATKGGSFSNWRTRTGTIFSSEWGSWGVARSWLFLYKGCYKTSLKSCTSHFTPLILLVQGVLLCCLSDCLCVHSCYHLNLWNIIIDMHIKFISAMHLGIC